MKKTLFTVFMLALVSASFAQFNQGRMLVGGSVGFSTITEKNKSGSSTNKYSTTNSFSFSPDVAYFVIDNLAVGGNVTFVTSKENYTGGNGSDKTTAYVVSPLVRYYVSQGFFGQGTFGVGSQKDVQTSQPTAKSSLTQWSLGVGYAYFLNDHVALEPIIKYQSTATKPDGSNVTTIDAGLALSVGVQVYLGERK